jgi:hypothetical protein
MLQFFNIFPIFALTSRVIDLCSKGLDLHLKRNFGFLNRVTEPTSLKVNDSLSDKLILKRECALIKNSDFKHPIVGKLRV